MNRSFSPRWARRFVLVGVASVVVSLGVVQSVQAAVVIAATPIISGISPSSGPIFGGAVTSTGAFTLSAAPSDKHSKDSKDDKDDKDDKDNKDCKDNKDNKDNKDKNKDCPDDSTTTTTTTTTTTVPVPPTPTALSGVAGNASVSLTWTAPAIPSAAINDYIIQYSSNGTIWTTFVDGVSTATSA
ncbi:MAG: hypothetical protein ACYC06_07275, partial [Ilumatobacteraceae bacterium]